MFCRGVPSSTRSFAHGSRTPGYALYPASPRRRHFGSVRKLPSGRYQASYHQVGDRHAASDTFATKADALAWLSTVEADIRRGQYACGLMTS